MIEVGREGGGRAAVVLANAGHVPLDSETEIQTARLELLPLRRAHAEPMFGVLADPLLYEFTGGTPPASVEDLALRYESWESRRSPDGSEIWLNWVVRERVRGEVVGHAQVTVAATQTDLAWVIGVRWQGGGCASEATRAVLDWLVSDLGVRKFRACIHPKHVASQRVAERAGFRRTDQWKDGEEVWTLEAADPATRG